MNIKKFDKKKWSQLKEKYPLNSQITGVVKAIFNYGIFLDIQNAPFLGFIRVTEIAPSDSNKKLPEVGETVTGVVVDHTDHNFQICISLKNQ